MQEVLIDLRLAVNYLPACACALQSVALSFLLCAIHSVRLVPAFVCVCLALVVHRATPRTLRIFDGSGVLFSIFLAHCVAALQELGHGWYTVWNSLNLAVSLEWTCFAGYFLWRPPSRRQDLHFLLAAACVHACACAFLHRPEGPEYRLVRLGRDLAFAGLCLVWTYVVGIYRRKLSRDPCESSSHFAVYFWPVLFVHPYAAAAYALACVAAVCAQLRPADPAQPAHEPASSPYTPPGSPIRVPAPLDFRVPAPLDFRVPAPLDIRVLAPPQPEGVQAEPDDEELFRQAMSFSSSAGQRPAV